MSVDWEFVVPDSWRNQRPQHRLYFLPLTRGQGWLRALSFFLTIGAPNSFRGLGPHAGCKYGADPTKEGGNMRTKKARDRQWLERQQHIEELREKLKRLPGGLLSLGFSEDCPPEIEEKFLEHVLAFEQAAEVPLFNELVKRGVQLPAPAELDDAQLGAKLWEVIQAMASLGAYLYNTDHLSDRELYHCLWTEILPEPTTLMPQNPNFSQHIDIVGTGSEEHLQLYLQYYADDKTRQEWAKKWPDLIIPAHETPPHDRDRYLPRSPIENPNPSRTQ